MSGLTPCLNKFSIRDGVEFVSQTAYKALKRQSFQFNEIKFLTAGNQLIDLNQNGKFDDLEMATKESLRIAITEWALDAENITIFIIGNGGQESFQINSDEILTSQEKKVSGLEF